MMILSQLGTRLPGTSQVASVKVLLPALLLIVRRCARVALRDECRLLLLSAPRNDAHSCQVLRLCANNSWRCVFDRHDEAMFIMPHEQRF